MGGAWVPLLVRVGIEEHTSIAVDVVAKLSGATLDGGCAIWRALMKEVQGGLGDGADEDAGRGKRCRLLSQDIGDVRAGLHPRPA